MHTFLQVMRAGSLSGAARHLGVAQPTVRRRVAALERDLGVTLFTRSAAGLRPTPEAERLRPLAETMEASARALTRAAASPPDRVEGVVRIAASVLVGAELLPPMLASLRRAHPGLAIELALSNEVADLARRDADVALRLARPQGASLVARRLGGLPFGFFAAPAYLADRAPPATLGALRDHDLVGYDRDPLVRQGLADLGLVLGPEAFAVRTDHHLAYLAAVRAGCGIGVTHLALAAPEGLARVLPELQLDVELWLVAHEDQRDVPRVRVVLDHLAAAFAPLCT